jgi:hypothetical protein
MDEGNSTSSTSVLGVFLLVKFLPFIIYEKKNISPMP